MTKNHPMKVSFEHNLFWLTKITGSNIEEIRTYCKNNNLTIVEETSSPLHGYIVQAEKPNQRMRILRKRVEEIDGWKLIEDSPTKKMHWLTYEKVSL